MIRIDDRTVEFTEAEDKAHDQFNEYLDRGYNIPRAAELALTRYRVKHGMPSDEFIDYLSDGTCKRWGQRVIIRTEWRYES